jgi:hypothetical protein
MLCIFCKKDSEDSKSVEHIIPESLWNTKQILPAGIVCDKCNNYFARKVEKPFLCSPLMIALRFHQAIPNKRGKIPSIEGVLAGSGDTIKVHRKLKGDYKLAIELDSEQFEKVLNNETDQIFYPQVLNCQKIRIFQDS